MDNAVVQAMTLAIALLGAVLGIINTWRAFNQDRVRVRVSVSVGQLDSGARCILVTAVNLSSFPVTVTHIGFDRVDGDTHMQIPQPVFLHGQTLPVRLETRTAGTVVMPLAAMENADLAALRRAYVRTACGRKICGGSTVCRQLQHAAATRS